MPGRHYAIKSFKDGSASLVKMTRKEIESSQLLAHLPRRPTITELTRTEAREAYRNQDFDVVESSISAEFK